MMPMVVGIFLEGVGTINYFNYAGCIFLLPSDEGRIEVG